MDCQLLKALDLGLDDGADLPEATPAKAMGVHGGIPATATSPHTGRAIGAEEALALGVPAPGACGASVVEPARPAHQKSKWMFRLF